MLKRLRVRILRFHRASTALGHTSAVLWFLGIVLVVMVAGEFVKPWAVEKFGRELYRIYFLAGNGAVLITLLVLVHMRTIRTERHLNWLTNVVHGHFKHLAAHELDGEAPHERAEPDRAKDLWPWGSHHTLLLGHLDAAARKWWQFYDPASPDTAPTNDMVSEWLIIERGVSKDKARAIASILRADGLRTGPR